ncbi:MAG TPA: hypothetical protein VF021_07895, partial [Longimicrobiales bacterium]
KPQGFQPKEAPPSDAGGAAGRASVASSLDFANSDLAFRRADMFLGNFNGFNIYDIETPKKPRVLASVVCPGGQGDMSVYGNLLFMSVEQTRGRVDCGVQGIAEAVSAERFRGVRIFDISDISKPKQIAAIQTCRGSHTHTLVTDPRDSANVYIYVSGVDVPRPASELAGCSALPPEKDPNTSFFRIDIIKVPVAAPQNAAIVSSPRIFADSAGNIAGLWRGGLHGDSTTQATARTDQCHDITVYPWAGLAAGACAGNGILLDVSDPANPKRIDQVLDPNFAYWHSATFNNDGTKVLFTDEWGGGMAPRCQATDRHEWGADAIFTLTQRKLKLGSYYKLPAAQSAMENCVAHNGSLIPVPGRDIMVQAWYQGGVSAFDFTEPDHPVEIAYFDRGPYDDATLHLGGYWSAYWYNGRIYGSEIGRGLDIFELQPTADLTQNEIDAARLAHLDVFNPQTQPHTVWPASFVVARAYIDQLKRSKSLPAAQLTSISRSLDRAEKLTGGQQQAALRTLVGSVKRLKTTSPADARRSQLLAATLQDLAG